MLSFYSDQTEEWKRLSESDKWNKTKGLTDCKTQGLDNITVFWVTDQMIFQVSKKKD